jgi:hypothetical protein
MYFRLHSDEQHHVTIKSEEVIAQNRIKKENELTERNQQPITTGANETKS